MGVYVNPGNQAFSRILGKNYVMGDARETIFDAEKCSSYMKKNYQNVGRGSVCGQCIAVCPKYKGSKS